MVTLLAEPGDRTRVSRGTPGGRPMLPVRQDPEWHLGPRPKPRSTPGTQDMRGVCLRPQALSLHGVFADLCPVSLPGVAAEGGGVGAGNPGGGFPRVLLHRSRGLVTHARPDGRTRMVHVYILFFSVF